MEAFEIDDDQLEDDQMDSTQSKSSSTIYRDSERNRDYRVLENVGRGRYGFVQKVALIANKAEQNEQPPSESGNQTFAIKVQEIFQADIPAKTQRELDILKTLKPQSGHHHVIQLLSNFMHSDCLCFVMPYYDTDLSVLLKTAPFPLDLIRTVLRQIFAALSYIHSLHILHRDMKPNNVLFDSSTQNVVITDLGSARDISDVLQNETPMNASKPTKSGQKENQSLNANNSNDDPAECDAMYSEDADAFNKLSPQVYVVQYRAPELLVGHRYYRPPIDIWPVGCIFAQMTRAEGALLFESDHDLPLFMEQMKVLGGPEKGELDGVGLFDCFFDASQMYAAYNDIRSYISYDVLLHDKHACDLLTGLLRFGPNRRLTAAQALKHPFFNNNDARDAISTARQNDECKQMK